MHRRGGIDPFPLNETHTMAKKPTGDAPDEAAPAATPEQGAPPPAAAKEKKPNKPKEAKAKPDAAPAGSPGPTAEGAAPAATSPALPPPDAPKRKGGLPGKPPRRGKKLRNQIKQQQQKLAKEGPMPLKRALQFLKGLKRAKFDETVEVHLSLGIDPTQSDQMIRGSVPLPHGLGKPKRVLVFCQGDDVAKAKEAGADHAGSDELIKRIQGEGWMEFDVALASQAMMGQVSRLGKVLGPRGLMPTPKAGTVIPTGQDVSVAVREFKAGKVEYRSDKGGNVHAGVGKLSFDDDKLVANVTAFVDQIRAVKPTGVKGNYIRSITVAATMTPGVPVSM
jgi:large subunit ribosomal protein L1